MDRWLVKGSDASQAATKRALQALNDENRRANTAETSAKKPKNSGLQLSAKAQKSTTIASRQGIRLPLTSLDDGHEHAKSIASNVLSRLYSKPSSVQESAEN